MASLVEFLIDHWGDLASVFGVAVSLVGFVYTLKQVTRSKEAAQRAEQAALSTRAKILMADTVMDLSSAIAMMEEIKRLHRNGEWNQLPDRYSALKTLLISIRTSSGKLSAEHSTSLLSSVQHFNDIEQRVERALARGKTPSNVSRLNEIVSLQLDRTHEILAVLKQQIGIEEYGGSKNN